MPSLRSRQAGFTLIEVLVVIAIIAIGLTLAVPYFGNAAKASNERSVIVRMQQDFMWARTAELVPDASTLGVSGATGQPTVVITVNADCSWSTTVNGNADPNHSMSTAQLLKTAPGLTCAANSSYTLTLPVSFTFNPQGTMTNAGTALYIGSTGTNFPLIFMPTGTVLINTSTSSMS